VVIISSVEHVGIMRTTRWRHKHGLAGLIEGQHDSKCNHSTINLCVEEGPITVRVDIVTACT